MSLHNKINTIVGWMVWLIATAVYVITMEDNVSFWDCGEFIPGSFKLQVVHPPGAPFFLLIGRIFTMFAAGNLEMVPVTINVLSAVSSSFTILFLFWSISMLSKKLLVKRGEEPTLAQTIAILGASLVGALAGTFADSFWFSAVEGEVYALSAFFTSITFWAILKWESQADEPYADRWLIFIAYMIGLSSGVHLLSLLVLPAIAFVYYFRKYEVTRMGLIKTFVIMGLILAFVLKVIITGLPTIFARFDLIFVNSFGLPFFSGALFGALLLIGGLIYGIYYARKKENTLLHKSLIALTMLLIGYSSYTMVLIRANAEPAINMSKPGDPFSLSSYLNREQYGDRPLLYGPIYTAERTGIKEGGNKYCKGEETYEVCGKSREPVYRDEDKMFFPRIYSQQDNHIRAYKNWIDVKEGQKPNFADNLKFFFKYQMGFMYWRYFMWNFSGRQNDNQGFGNRKDGNWLSGIPFIDEMRVPSQSNLPESITSNKARNKFFMLPFIFGLIGLFYQYKKSKKDFSVVTLLFLFTGAMILIVESNEPPIEPRERDYALAWSFLAYSIWIGMSVLWLYEFLMTRKLSAKISAPMAAIICFVAAPLLMGMNGWDDHDRSTRLTARDFANNYLESCAPNAILFTQGDNDTYPLWYAQEVEGIRTDIRVVNLSLIAVDWYIDKLKKKINNADAIKISYDNPQYRGSNREYIPFFDNNKLPQNRFYNLSEIMKFVGSEDKRTKVPVSSGDLIDYLPTKNFSIPVDKEKVIANGTVPEELTDEIVPNVAWTLNKGAIYRGEMILLDILAQNNWDRPIYFAISVSPDAYLGLEDYFQLEGLTYRFIPVKTGADRRQPGRVATDLMYHNMMNKFHYGNMDKDGIYLDEGILRMTYNLRNNFARLAEKLLQEGKKDSATALLDKCLEVMPDKNVPYNIYMIPIPRLYYEAGESEKANKIVTRLAEISEDDLDYYLGLDKEDMQEYQTETQQAMAVMQELTRMTRQYGQTELNTELEAKFQAIQGKASNVPNF